LIFSAIELGIVAYIALYLLFFLLLSFGGDLPLVWLIKGHLEKMMRIIIITYSEKPVSATAYNWHRYSVFPLRKKVYSNDDTTNPS